MYRYFERLIDPLAPQPVVRPPADTFGFFRFHLASSRGVVVAILVLAGIASITELLLYVYLGRVLDWMTTEGPIADGRADFLARHGAELAFMVLVVGVARPLSLLGSRALINLALAPGLANATRWQNHRYVLRQSMSFFEDDFRLAQRQ